MKTEFTYLIGKSGENEKFRRENRDESMDKYVFSNCFAEEYMDKYYKSMDKVIFPTYFVEGYMDKREGYMEKYYKSMDKVIFSNYFVEGSMDKGEEYMEKYYKSMDKYYGYMGKYLVPGKNIKFTA